MSSTANNETTSTKTVRAIAKKRPPSSANNLRPYSPYNLFYILEHRLVLQERGGSFSKDEKDVFDNKDKKLELIRSTYGDIQVPPLPARYQSIAVPCDWFVHGKKKERRVHRKTHGKIAFTELSRTMGRNWKTVDDETRKYVKNLSDLLCQKWEEKEQRRAEEQKAALEKVTSSCIGDGSLQPFEAPNRDIAVFINEYFPSFPSMMEVDAVVEEPQAQDPRMRIGLVDMPDSEILSMYVLS